ncbi:hypothetical protein B8W69_09960 [Mycobacterium vulneris]|uniref:Uncharacterized protein n=1 Tax=Mycolicibacterium vulneris TaxID=547163 RepID=A0A1X2L5Q8_9MYCO|nr:hypothetical protein B8W69_09960 [Mycolicibacterium vulneris]
MPGCVGRPGANCDGPGTPLPPGQRWMPPGQPGDYPVVFHPDVNPWGVFLPGGQFVAYAA